MSRCVAVCCSVLQCVAVCCSVLQCVAVCQGVICMHTRTRHTFKHTYTHTHTHTHTHHDSHVSHRSQIHDYVAHTSQHAYIYIYTHISFSISPILPQYMCIDLFCVCLQLKTILSTYYSLHSHPPCQNKKKGKISAMAPERLCAVEHSQKSDVWSLG